MGTTTIVGVGASVGNNLIALGSMPATTLQKLNVAAQAAAAINGIAAAVNPLNSGAAVAAGLSAITIQTALLVSDAKNNPSLTTIGNDLLGAAGDVAIIGGATAAAFGFEGGAQAFEVLGVAADTANIYITNPQAVINDMQNVVNSVSSTANSALSAIGSYVSIAEQDLKNLVGATSSNQSSVIQGTESNLNSAADNTLPTIESGSDISFITANLSNAGPSSEQTTFTDSAGQADELLSGTGPSNNLANANNTNVALLGDDTQATVQEGRSVALDGPDQSLNAQGGTPVISGSDDTIHVSPGTVATVEGNGDTLHGVADSGSTTTITGSGDTYTNTSSAASAHGADTVDITGNSLSDTIHTSPNVNIEGSGDSVTATGENVNITGTAGGDSVVITQDAHDTVYFQSGTNTYNTSSADDSNGANRVELENSGTSATIYGTPVVSVDGSNESVDLMNRGASIYVPANESGDVIDGTNYTVYEGGNDGVTLEGSGSHVVNDTRKDSNGAEGYGTGGSTRGGTNAGGGPVDTGGGYGGGGYGGTGGYGGGGGSYGGYDFREGAKALSRRSAGFSASQTGAGGVASKADTSGSKTDLGAIARYDRAKGFSSAATAAEKARAQAQAAAAAGTNNLGAATTPAFEGPKWEAATAGIAAGATTASPASSPATAASTIAAPTSAAATPTTAPTITWSFATSPGTAADPFSGYLSARYKATVEQAIQAWATASGLNFEEVPDSASSDLRIGWGDFSPSSGVLGLTTASAQNGALQPGTFIRLEDPSQNAIAKASGGQLTYAGTGATLYQVVLHEIGHALGLADNSDTSSVMFASSSKANRTLDTTDISGIQSLYGTTPATSPGTSTIAAGPAGASESPLASAPKASAASTSSSLNQMVQAMAAFAPKSATASLAKAAQVTTPAATLAATAGHH